MAVINYLNTDYTLSVFNKRFFKKKKKNLAGCLHILHKETSGFSRLTGIKYGFSKKKQKKNKLNGWVDKRTNNRTNERSNKEDRKGPEVELFSILCSSSPCFSLKAQLNLIFFQTAGTLAYKPGDELFERL